MGSSESVCEAAIHLGACLLAEQRPGEALRVVAEAAVGEPSLFDAAAAVVRARALHRLGREAEAAAEIRQGIWLATSRGLNYELARLLLLSDELGVDGAREDAVAEAHRLMTELGLVGSVSDQIHLGSP